jgi:hypothetical protein
MSFFEVIIEQPHLQASLENVNILTLLQPLWKTIPQQWSARRKTYHICAHLSGSASSRK